MGKLVATKIPSKVFWGITQDQTDVTEKVANNLYLVVMYQFSKVASVYIKKLEHFTFKDTHDLLRIIGKTGVFFCLYKVKNILFSYLG